GLLGGISSNTQFWTIDFLIFFKIKILQLPLYERVINYYVYNTLRRPKNHQCNRFPENPYRKYLIFNRSKLPVNINPTDWEESIALPRYCTFSINWQHEKNMWINCI